MYVRTSIIHLRQLAIVFDCKKRIFVSRVGREWIVEEEEEEEEEAEEVVLTSESGLRAS